MASSASRRGPFRSSVPLDRFQEEEDNLHYRLFARSHTPLSHTASPASPILLPLPRSIVLSTSRISSRYSTATPSLSSSVRTGPTESVATSAAQPKLYSTFRRIGDDGEFLDEEEAVLGSCKLSCLFYFLGCTESFDDAEPWISHCGSHLLGHQPPEIQCPFCLEESIEGPGAWEYTMKHIAHHLQKGQTIQLDKDQALFTYLWQKSIIDEQEYRELKQTSHLEPGSRIYTRTESKRHERKRTTLSGAGSNHRHNTQRAF